ncbi:hypothetical protein AB4Y45_33770 [Paraburkholderia sp. EG287A]|uniref:hypothetical protein n=1 Tax=Paraburkholderia sp. EG287A TaxID=3237012 RepID=UPI0034D326CE
MYTAVHFLNDALITIFLAHVLFFLAKQTHVYSEWDLALTCRAVGITVVPMSAATLSMLDVPVQGWLTLANEPVGAAMRLCVVVLCFGLSAWSPWEQRTTKRVVAV